MNARGSVVLACDAVDGATRLRSIRCDGLSRSSRAFAAPSGGLRLMLSTLGPGVLSGDRFTVEGNVAQHASLVAGAQMATPVFAGADPSRTDAAWHVADGAALVVAGEPLLLEPGCTHAAGATFALEGSGTAIVVDAFGFRGPARLSMRTSATLDGRLVYRDAYDVEGDAAGAFGTVTLLAAGGAERAAFLARAQSIAAATATVRTGTGETAAAIVVRMHGARVWDVRALALAIAGVG